MNDGLTLYISLKQKTLLQLLANVAMTYNEFTSVEMYHLMLI